MGVGACQVEHWESSEQTTVGLVRVKLLHLRCYEINIQLHKEQQTVVVFLALGKNILPSARGTQGMCDFDGQPKAAVRSQTTTHSERKVDVNTVTWFHAGNLGNA